MGLFIDSLRPILAFLALFMPGISAVLFLVHLCLFLRTKSKNEKLPGSVPLNTLKSYKLYMILSGILFAVSTVFFIVIISLALTSISYM